MTKGAGLLSTAPRFGAGCTFVDYDRDGQLDLFVSNYLQFDEKTIPRPDQTGACNYLGVPVNCGPRGLPYGHHSLYHNNGDGTFTDVTDAAGIGKVEGGFGLTVVAADFDNDGWPDIYVACDSTPSLLFRNNHDGTFTEEGLERGVALSEDGMEQAGMGLGIGDFNLDGSLDIVKTHFRDDTPVLYQNDGKGNFRDVTIRSGLGVETRFVSWGAGIVDLDNDGNPDIFWVTGNVYPEVEKKFPHVAVQDAPRRLPQSRRRAVRGVAGAGRAGRRGRALEPGLRLRRFRQRRRRGHPHRESERAAVAAAERRQRRPPLDQGEAARGQVESQRDRRARDGALWR